MRIYSYYTCDVRPLRDYAVCCLVNNPVREKSFELLSDASRRVSDGIFECVYIRAHLWASLGRFPLRDYFRCSILSYTLNGTRYLVPLCSRVCLRRGASYTFRTRTLIGIDGCFSFLESLIFLFATRACILYIYRKHYLVTNIYDSRKKNCVYRGVRL